LQSIVENMRFICGADGQKVAAFVTHGCVGNRYGDNQMNFKARCAYGLGLICMGLFVVATSTCAADNSPKRPPRLKISQPASTGTAIPGGGIAVSTINGARNVAPSTNVSAVLATSDGGLPSKIGLCPIEE
jgi:hypothetical protein